MRLVYTGAFDTEKPWSGPAEVVMAEMIHVHGFETSNNMKVRVALGYKRIPYEFHTIDPADRTGVVSLSGQHLTPVVVHGDRVLFDSAAILRYLDANFRDTPPLFGRNRDEQWEIEDWELYARAMLAAPMMQLVHHRVAGGTVDEAMQARCADAFKKTSATLIDALAGREWLVSDQLSAADVTAAAVIYRVRSAKIFDPPPGVEAIAEWVDRVMNFDRMLA
jgi:glutathione S-transferase